MSRAVYRICVCEYAYSGAHGAPYWADFTGNGARSRALEVAREALQRSSVTHVQIVNVSNGRAFCNGRLVLDVRNDLAKPPASACEREIQLGKVQ